jgi:hypothetical protein
VATAPTNPPVSSSPAAALPPPTGEDSRRYRRARAGQSLREIAASEGVSIESVEQSILRVRVDNDRYSANDTGLAVRRLFERLLPSIECSLDQALAATKMVGRKVLTVDTETGRTTTLDETSEVADHDTRLRAVAETRALVSVVQPRDPAVQITSTTTTNTQHNTLNAGLPGPTTPGLTSPEAIIRTIQAQRVAAGALTARSADSADPPVPTAIATIIEGDVMPRVGRLTADEDDEIEDGEDAEDEDEEEEEEGDEDDDDDDAADDDADSEED